ncbi:predicted protein [Bathycoccus prasinos]|uniref:Uncharacterized protein n=1 Tax=Bathycoccus prasinos TaxID=41875 RepID=K8ERK1_9CHLO|nr:predicted protein [Bathycoccus prasinos]CCO15035.1 predicted protein [Bathycoccus prasinos]|eukprot:XP_007514795.1 predicted protein [Bathycoccus prasinos]
MGDLKAVFSSLLGKESAKKVRKDKDKDKKKDKRKREKKEKKKKKKEKGKDKTKEKIGRRIEKKKKKKEVEEEEEEEPEENQRNGRAQQELPLQQVDGYEIYEEEEEEEEEEVQEHRGQSVPRKRKKKEILKPRADKSRKKPKENNDDDDDDDVQVAGEQEGRKNWKWNAHNLEGQKYGQWSETEQEALTNALETWCRSNRCLDKFNRKDYSFLLRERNQSRRELDKTIYYEISAEVNTRNPQQCYERIRRTLIRSAKGADELRNKEWSDEEKVRLKSLVDRYGNTAWNEIGKRLGRDGQNCRDKYRSTFDIFDENRGEVKKGRFSDEERAKFRKIMEEYYEEHGIELGNPEDGKHGEFLDNISWTVVAKKLGGNRSEKSCFTHWKNVLAAGEKGDFMVENGAWGGYDDDASLLEQVKEQCISDEMNEVDVDFSLITVPGRSQTQIVRRWKFLKQRTDTRKVKALSKKIEKYEAKVVKERRKEARRRVS